MEHLGSVQGVEVLVNIGVRFQVDDLVLVAVQETAEFVTVSWESRNLDLVAGLDLNDSGDGFGQRLDLDVADGHLLDVPGLLDGTGATALSEGLPVHH